MSKMRIVRVLYRQEADGWWAESPDVPGYTAVGRDHEEVRQMIREGLPYFLGETLGYLEEIIAPSVTRPSVTSTCGLSFKHTKRF